MLVSSHILAEVAQTVDSVVILDKGRLVTQSSLDELVHRTTRKASTQDLEEIFLKLTSEGAGRTRKAGR